MPIDPDLAAGAELPSRSFAWTESDVLLYHLTVGFGSRPGDQLDPDTLTFTTETGTAGPLQVLPSFGIVAPTFHETAAPSLDMPGVDISLAQVVHGSQAVTLARPLPTSGRATLTTRISDVWDKGKAAVIVQESTAVDEVGQQLFTTRSSIFVRADPGFADDAGCPAPILHGLCSYGIVLREVLQGLLDSDVSRVAGFSARFAGVVLPGETIRTTAWQEDDRVLVHATVAAEGTERDGAPVLADAVVDLRS